MIKENFYIFDNYLIKQKIHLSFCLLSYLVFGDSKEKYIDLSISFKKSTKNIELYLGFVIGWIRLTFYI